MTSPILDHLGAPIEGSPGAICAFGYDNAVPSASLTATSEIATMPVTNLASAQGAPAYAWRSPATTATVTIRPGYRRAWRAFSLHRTNLTTEALWRVVVLQGSAAVYDSGLIATALDQGQCVLALPAEAQGDAVAISIADPRNPDGYLSIALAYAGGLWQPQRNMSWQGSEGTDGAIDEATSLSGVEYPQFRWSRRTVSIDHESLGAEELPIVRAIGAAGWAGSNVLFVPDPSGGTINSDAIFGRLTPSDIGNPAQGANRRSTKMTIKERL